MRGRRTPYEIYWEVLVFCREPRTFTNIINRCDLNSKIGQQHLSFLTSKGYLDAEERDGRTAYRTTEKAQEYIALFSRMYGALFDDVPGFKL
ncbi:winged helix-turn-helix domain-containing protein [Methanomassiliicoccus luminyensis]|jgi:predicted transcriptional regulator|uniref:winged helix-turn-helix domain-containing protein n=1 Tax=Methanomassiliicoccus luminyensis TaxID=1080712 RepID=UPI00035F1348|nr:winged helix-turn-helix domain-containing protein [Methanomassiliicoccus luminyensis]